jgi:hypothetical protein
MAVMRQDEFMMHECPKCGFVQPKDRYCANCGLDIDLYKPEPEPLTKKLLNNTSAQIFVVIAIVVAIGASIYISQKEQLEKQLAQVLNSTAQETYQDEALPDDEPNIAPAQTMATEQPAATQRAAPATAPPPVEKSSSVPRKLVITFAEVSKTVLQQLASEGQIVSESSQTRSVLSPLQNPSSLKDRDPEFNLLPGGDSETIRVGAPITLDFTHISSTNEDVGLSLQVMPVQNTDNNVEIGIDGTLRLRNDAEQLIANQDINANYIFSTKNTLILIGFLPREDIKNEDSQAFSQSPLAIYESTSFLNGLTDFVIFVQVR